MKVVKTDVIYFLLMPFGLSENLCIFFKSVTGHVRILKHENVVRLLIFQEQSSSQGIEPNGENLVFIEIISRNLARAKLTMKESTGDTIVFSEV